MLAPLAFFAAATALVLVVHRSLTSEERAGSPAQVTATTGATQTTGPTTTRRGTGARRFYRVKEGEVLETIAARFDTTVDDLLRLNPGIDPNSLQPGQRIRVR